MSFDFTPFYTTGQWKSEDVDEYVNCMLQNYEIKQELKMLKKQKESIDMFMWKRLDVLHVDYSAAQRIETYADLGKFNEIHNSVLQVLFLRPQFTSIQDQIIKHKKKLKEN